MGIMAIFFVAILAFYIITDTLLGLIRGRNRSLLRLGLVAFSAVISLLLHKSITNLIMDVNFGEGSINQLIYETLANSDTPLPDSIANFAFALVEIVLGVFVFVLLFLAVKFITWLVAFPIIKIFVRSEEKKNRGLGALIGAAQGLLTAIIVCGCLSGVVVEANKVTDIKIDGEQMIVLPDELGIQKYASSPLAKGFDMAGGWVFDIVSTTTDDSGRKVSISSICNTASTLLSVTEEITSAYSSLDSTGGTTTDSIKNVADAFINVGTAIENLDDDSKVLVNDLISDVKEIAANALGELPPELETVIDNIDVEEIKIKSAGEALGSIAKYVEEGEVTQDDINNIVNGIADNMFVLEMLGVEDASLIEVDGPDADKFITAIENADLTQEDMLKLYSLFGLN